MRPGTVLRERARDRGFLSRLRPPCSGAIVETWVRENGDTEAPVDPERARALVAALR